MTFPSAVSFHGIDSSDVLRDEVLERIRRLEHVLDDILACRVVVEAARDGGHYGTYLRLLMPCIEIEAGGEPTLDARHRDPHMTVADAFDLLTDRLDNFVRLRCRSCSKYVQSDCQSGAS